MRARDPDDTLHGTLGTEEQLAGCCPESHANRYQQPLAGHLEYYFSVNLCLLSDPMDETRGPVLCTSYLLEPSLDQESYGHGLILTSCSCV